MAYNNAIPQATDNLSVSQGNILDNFTAIDAGTTGNGIGFSRNHITMTDATNGGLHNRVDYYQAVSSPSISGFIGSAYAKTVTHAELFYKNGTQDMQISNSLLTASSGQGMLPGGLQIRTGSGSLTPNNTNQNFSYSTAFPNATLAAFAIPSSSDQTHVIQFIYSSNASQATFKSNNGSSAFTIYYVAIGY